MATIKLSSNTQPVYPREVIQWKVKLTNQVTPREVTTQVPVLVGQAGGNGSIIHAIDVRSLGGNVATKVFLYVLASGDTVYYYEDEVSVSTTVGGEARVLFDLPPILPSGNKGLHLESGASLYCGLETTVAAGLILTVRGGNY